MSSKTELYKKRFTEDSWPGLEAINEKKSEIYGNQVPVHWATIVPYEIGGEDPLWAVECFVNEKQQQHFHYITLGFTNLWYDEEFAEDETNKFGFEITFRYIPLDDEFEVPTWPANFLQNIAKYVFNSENGFDDFHYMSANGPIRAETGTKITAFVFYKDKQMGEIDTPHGPVKFLQLYGITTEEYTNIRNKKYSARQLIAEHIISNPLLITDLNRK